MKELKYTSGEAAYRVCAVKLMRESKKIEAKLKSGELNLSTAVLVHNHFSTHEKKPSLKILEESVQRVSGKTKSEAKEILAGRPKIIRETIKKKTTKEECLDLLAELLQYAEGKEVKEFLKMQISRSKDKLAKTSQKVSDPKKSRYIPRAVKFFGASKMDQYSLQLCRHDGNEIRSK